MKVSVSKLPSFHTMVSSYQSVSGNNNKVTIWRRRLWLDSLNIFKCFVENLTLFDMYNIIVLSVCTAKKTMKIDAQRHLQN